MGSALAMMEVRKGRTGVEKKKAPKAAPKKQPPAKGGK